MKTITTILFVSVTLVSIELFSQPIRGYSEKVNVTNPPRSTTPKEITQTFPDIQVNESEIQIPSGRKETIVFSESFSNNSLDNKWIANPSTEGMSSIQDIKQGKVLKIESKDRNRTICLEYDLTKLVVGKHIKLSALIKHENVVSGSKSWEIGQLAIEYRFNQSKIYGAVQDLEGTSDWAVHYARNDGGTEIDDSEYGDYAFKVPSNATHVRLYLGLQNCTGIIYFKDIKVIVLE